MLAAALVVSTPADARSRRDPNATPLRNVSYAKPPPDFEFDLGQGKRRLHDLIGRPVVLNFWATWCEPCRDEMDAFLKLQRRYGSQVVLLTVAAQLRGIARSYLDQHGLGELPLIEDDDRKITEAYSVGPLPATIILKPDGTVERVHIGEIRWEDLEAGLAAVLPGR